HLAGLGADADLTHAPRYDAALGERVRMARVALDGDGSGAFPADGALQFRVTFEVREPTESVRFWTSISKIDGTPVGLSFGEEFPAPKPGRPAEYLVTLNGHRLAPCSYRLGLGLGVGDGE